MSITAKQCTFYITSNKLNDNIIFLDYGYSSVGKLFAL